MKKVNLYYFGDRNYIDISTNTKCFYEACQIQYDSVLIDSESVHIKKAITKSGYLIEGPSSESVCDFKFSLNNKLQTYSYIENGELITERRPEMSYNLEDYFEVTGKTGSAKKQITAFMTYNLMVFGKAVIVNNTKKIPRVVKTDLFFNIHQSEYKDLQIHYSELKNNFIILKSYIKSKHHGNVIVKLI